MPFIRPTFIINQEGAEIEASDIKKIIEVKNDEVILKTNKGTGRMNIHDVLDYADALELSNQQAQQQIERLKYQMQEMRAEYAARMEEILKKTATDASAEFLEKKLKDKEALLEASIAAQNAASAQKPKEQQKRVSVADKPTKCQPSHTGITVLKKKIRQDTGHVIKPAKEQHK